MKLTERAAEVQRLHREWVRSDHDDSGARDRLIVAAAELADQTIHGATTLRELLVALRGDFGRLHVIGVDDEPTAADYRDHDEHNADVREDIHASAESLAAHLDDWLGAPGDAVTHDQERS